MAFLILLILIIVLTAKIWGPWIKDSAEDLEITLTHRKNDRQVDLKELNEAIDKMIAKHNGKVFSLEEIQQKLNPKKEEDNG